MDGMGLWEVHLNLGFSYRRCLETSKIAKKNIYQMEPARINCQKGLCRLVNGLPPQPWVFGGKKKWSPKNQRLSNSVQTSTGFLLPCCNPLARTIRENGHPNGWVVHEVKSSHQHSGRLTKAMENPPFFMLVGGFNQPVWRILVNLDHLPK